MRHHFLLAAGIALFLIALSPAAAAARIVLIPPSFRVGPVRANAGDGLLVRFKDVPSGCGLALCQSATDTVTVQITKMPSINFLLNTGCSFGPFAHGCGYFETRWDAYLNVQVEGDYVFSMQVDDGGSVAIGDSTILALDGGHWFENVVSDTIRFVISGSYPLRAYYNDCQPCCRGFRLGAMGPPGSGMMAFTPGFNFNSDLGPCCTYGSNGPGASLVPATLFFSTPPTVSVAPPAGDTRGSAILDCRASPNPFHRATLLAVELAREQQVWVEVFDASGRRVATLASGERYPAGTARWPWSPGWGDGAARTSGTYFYRVRTADGSQASGRLVAVY
jgi:hypothetical protein